MANTVINTPELLNLDSTTGATVLAKGTINERPSVQTFSVEYLAVAGGGGGGYQDGGGGGAGGFLTNTLSSINNGQSFTLTIGEGGAGGTKTPAVVNSGDNTIIAYGSTTITAIGGGGGSSDNNGAGGAADGGSGGGGASGSGTRTGGSGTPGQGNDGGDGNASNQGGGGGGAGAAGQNATSSGANGGIGLTTTIISTTNAATASVGEVSGSNLYFAGGGGGDNRTVFGSGGLGGGSNAAVNPVNATANTGGGGGSAFGGSPATGGAGGSGVIILKYDSSATLTKGSGLTEASGSPFTEGSYKVSVFTQGTGNVTLSTTPDALDAINGTLRFNTDTNKTEYYDGTGWYEIVDEYASGFVGPATNYFDTKLYTGNGAAQSIGGYINGSASFNGSSSYIDTGLDLDTLTNYTISMWIKVDASPGSNMIFAGTINSSAKTGIYLSIDTNNTIRFFERNSSTTVTNLQSTDTINIGAWNHIVAVRDGSTNYIYINNGTPASLSNNSISHSVDFTIGRAGAYTSSYFDGEIDQVRIFNTGLSASNVTALYGETAATATTAAFPSGQTAVATYTMDTSANGLLNTQDLSTVNYPAGAGCLALYEMNGNTNDTGGTYNGTPTNITYEGGAFDQAAVFNGSSSVVTINSIFDFSSSFSISMWFNADTLPSSTYMPLFFTDGYGGSSSDYGVALYLYGNTIRPWIDRQGTYTNIFTAGTLSTGTWYHVVLNRDYNSKWELFLNGSSLGTYTGVGLTDNYTPSSFSTIGKHANSSMWFDGKIDQVRIFNAAPTQAQVTTLARGIATSYSGAAANVNFNGHLNFAPDLVWLKSRDRGTTPYTGSHYWFDSIRGALQRIKSNDADPENTFSNSLTSFDTNGFSLGSGSNVNYNGDDFVAWNWKAGGTAVTNNDGTITSQVSANKDSGFIIVKYTGNATAGATVAHGLDNPPDLIIVKSLDASKDWYVFSELLGQSGGEYQYLELNTTDSATTFNTQQVWNGVLPTSDVFTLTGGSADNTINDDYIAYCFHSVAGYSKIGSYSGTGSSGNSINVGFDPRFIMFKNTSASGQWWIHDAVRGDDKRLFAEVSNAESTSSSLTTSSTGFTLNDANSNLNASGNTYIYMAIA